MFAKLVTHSHSQITIAIAVSLAVLIGTALAQIYAVHSLSWLWLIVPALALSWRVSLVVRLLCLVTIAGGIGLWRGTQLMTRLDSINALDGRKVTLVGVAGNDAVYGQKYQLTFDLREVHVLSPSEQPLIGMLTISGFGESAILKGDTVLVAGTIKRSPGNSIARISFGKLQVLGHHTTALDSLRRRFTAGMQSALPEPVASFGLGLLVGQRNTLPEDVSEQLKVVGLTHIIAVSGYNLMIILRATNRLLRERSKYQYACLSLGLMLLFVLLAGSSPSIVRASVICSLGLAAWYYGRTIKPVVLLLVSAAMTAIANPLYIWGNVSWYLSFLAFFGVLVVAPACTAQFYKHRKPGFVAAIIIECMCAEVMTLPYVLYIFGQLSTVGIAANLLVAALVPLAMLLGLVAGLAGMCMPLVAGWLAWPASMVMTYMLDIAAVLSRSPHAFIENIGFPLWMLVASYMVVGFMLLLGYHSRAKYAIITDKIKPALPASSG